MLLRISLDKDDNNECLKYLIGVFCAQQVEDELNSPVVLFKFSQEISAGKGLTLCTRQTWLSQF